MKNFIFKIYGRMEFYPFLTPIKDIITLILRKVPDINKIKDSLLKNKEGNKDYNISIEWFNGDKKPLGISGVARLKDSDDFLESVIENHLSFLDEIILVDNLSSDKTKEICLNLQKKYPDKIKFYEYPFKIDFRKNIDSNSLNSLSYYYNWSFSKSKYKYVMKVDDDNYFDIEKMKEIRKFILDKKPRKFISYWGLNLLEKDNKIGVFEKFPYTGKYLDHGIYPVSNKTYYIMKGIYEGLQYQYLVKRMGFSYFHLKNLKKEYGFKHLPSYKKEYALKLISETKVLDISSFISNNLDRYRDIITEIRNIKINK